MKTTIQCNYLIVRTNLGLNPQTCGGFDLTPSNHQLGGAWAKVPKALPAPTLLHSDSPQLSVCVVKVN